MVKEFSDKRIKYLWLVVLYTSVFLLLFFVLYGFKTVTGDVCSSNSVSNGLGVGTLTVTDSANLSFPVIVPNNQFQNVDYQNFCFQAIGSSSTFNTITHKGASVHINNLTSGVSCFNNLNASKDSYKVLTCTTCSPTNNITYSLSSEEVIVVTNGVPAKNNNIYYSSYQLEGCEETYKTIVNIYFAILGLVLFLFLLIRAIDWFNKFIGGGW